MIHRVRTRHAGLALALFLGLACDASSAGPGSGDVGPPSRYPPSEVRLSVRHQPGRRVQPASGVTVFGTGRCERLQAGEQVECPALADAEVLALLNAFYTIDFLGLPPSYTTRRSVVQLDDGQLQVQALRLADTGSTTLCLGLASFEKCVSFAGREPAFLEALAARLLALGASSPTR